LRFAFLAGFKQDSPRFFRGPSWLSPTHSAMLQSKLDGAFAQYHNEVQDMQTKSDELVRKNKLLRNKNKGTLLSCRVPIGSTLQLSNPALFVDCRA
jgi:porphobilinogen deaminase